MWIIKENKRIEKVFNKLPHSVKEKYQLWKSLVRYNGPKVLKQFPGFHDEKLKGDHKGQRSSRLSLKYRVIYEVEERIITVYILEITPHKY